LSSLSYFFLSFFSVTLKAFRKFADNTEGLEACTALVESKIPKSLKEFLKSSVKEKEEQLLVADAHLGNAIKSKFDINCIFNEKLNQELCRAIRSNISEVITALTPDDARHMSLGLAHSYSRYKLKFSPDKVDTMIVQAVALLDDLDKEINTYAMRSREWYGWHFPELSKVITDNNVYCKLILAVGIRTNFAASDLSEFIPEDIEAEVKALAPVSMGTEISEEDITNVKELCSQVVEISEYREQLWDYLKSRMQAIAPNLTALVGELVGARLIAHTGSLLNLAKYPASTIQILGAEKALFRALKSKKKTPKYGLIYHASLIGQAPQKNK
jgi:nucleolar protein 58